MGTLCIACKENQGKDVPAVRLMPQSLDEGQTVTYMPACEAHVAGWWDGADWDGRHLERPVVDDADHDRRNDEAAAKWQGEVERYKLTDLGNCEATGASACVQGCEYAGDCAKETFMLRRDTPAEASR